MYPELLGFACGCVDLVRHLLFAPYLMNSPIVRRERQTSLMHARVSSPSCLASHRTAASDLCRRTSSKGRLKYGGCSPARSAQ